MAALPAETRLALGKPPLGALLEWGTAPPPSPMSRFRQLSQLVRDRATAQSGGGGTSAAPAPGLSQFLSVWRALAAAASTDAEIDAAFIRAQATSYAMLPLGRTLVRLPRAICRLPPSHPPSMRSTQPGSAPSQPGSAPQQSSLKPPVVSASVSSLKPPVASAPADEALVECLVQQGWLLDVSSDAALRELARPLAELLQLPRSPPLSTVQRWLQQLWRAAPPLPTSAEAIRLRTTFSLACRYCIGPLPSAHVPSHMPASPSPVPRTASCARTRPRMYLRRRVHCLICTA